MKNKCEGCFWLRIHQDLRPCRGCNDEHNRYVTEEEIKNRPVGSFDI